jgi:glycosyltransferase involved in cell wall biosynthesis
MNNNAGQNKPGMLMVGNWKSDVGYAWWLMESFWATLAGEFSGKYHVMLTYPEVNTVPDEIREAPIEVLEYDLRTTSPLKVIRVLQLLCRENIKVLYLSDWPAVHWKYPLFHMAGVRKIIVHDHTPGMRIPPAPMKQWLKSRLTRSLFAADAMIAVSDFVRKRHIEVNCFPPEKCYTASNGIRFFDATAPPDVHAQFGIPANRQVMVMTGRANRYKGVDFVLRCMAVVVNDRRRQDLHFLFCGDGPDLGYFRCLTGELGITDYVSLPGRCDDIPAILAACDFAIHASRGEVGYSLSILEYMYAGLPVLVPSNPSVSGATTERTNGMIYEENSIDSAAEKIEFLLDSPDEMNRMGKNARNTVISEYSLENTHRQLLESINNIL